MPRIDIFRNDTLEMQVALADKPLRIGRGERCDIRVNDRKVSRHHALIMSTPNGYLIRDFSLNGTWVNEQRVVGDWPLALGDRIQVGEKMALVVGRDNPRLYREGVTEANILVLMGAKDLGVTVRLEECDLVGAENVRDGL